LQGAIQYVIEPAGQLFLRLLFVLLVPLLFSALVVGIAEIDLHAVRRLGARTLSYTLVVSFISVCIGLGLVNTIGPGRGVHLARAAEAPQTAVLVGAQGAPGSSLVEIMIGVVPRNAVEAAAKGDMLPLVVFSLLFGIALSATKGEPSRQLRNVIAGLYDVCMTWIGAVLRYCAPVGVFALLFSMAARIGTAALTSVASYVSVVLLGLLLQNFVVYALSVRLFGGMAPRTFFRGVRVAMLTAFSTASSSATLPTAIQVAEDELLLPPPVARFVLTAGSAMNQNGTALFEGVTVIFLAQVAGVELPLGKQLVVMAISLLAGVGTAGVPGGSLPALAMILAMLGVPAEGLGLVAGVDRFLDMCRTTVNVTGDLAAAVYVARGERLSAAASATRASAP
jgi:DAACS family dicarboxylate/amino acid:cation (Na+ or H+) symporter